MKKYKKGAQIKTISAFDKCLANNQLIYIDARVSGYVRHPIILANMPYRVVKRFIDNGQVYKARRIK